MISSCCPRNLRGGLASHYHLFKAASGFDFPSESFIFFSFLVIILSFLSESVKSKTYLVLFSFEIIRFFNELLYDFCHCLFSHLHALLFGCISLADYILYHLNRYVDPFFEIFLFFFSEMHRCPFMEEKRKKRGRVKFVSSALLNMSPYTVTSCAIPQKRILIF